MHIYSKPCVLIKPYQVYNHLAEQQVHFLMSKGLLPGFEIKSIRLIKKYLLQPYMSTIETKKYPIDNL